MNVGAEKAGEGNPPRLVPTRQRPAGQAGIKLRAGGRAGRGSTFQGAGQRTARLEQGGGWEGNRLRTVTPSPGLFSHSSPRSTGGGTAPL